MVLPAPAKLNLFLHVIGRRDDGLHDLQTVFQLLDYSDTLSFRLRADKEIHITCDADIELNNNTVYQAAALLREHTGVSAGADIQIQKKIPIGAGLGGGSSNAATALHGLNQIWQTDCRNDELLQLALSIGADVPAFVFGHSAWGEGAGERLKKLSLPDRYFAVFIPQLAVSTRAMFNQLERYDTYEPLDPDSYRIGDGKNVFQSIATRCYPEIAAGIEWLTRFAPARLSGTGSAFFAMFEDEHTASSVVSQCPSTLKAFVAQGVACSPLHSALGLQIK